MSLWSEMEADGPEFLAEFGRPVTFRGASTLMLVSRAPIEQMLADGGFTYRVGYSVRVYIPAGSPLLTNPPVYGESMVIFGRKQVITQVNYRPPAPWFDVTTADDTTV